MDWNLKAPAWDLTELEQADISAVQGSSSCGDNKSRSDFSIDLKLGRVGNFTEEMVDKWKEPRVGKISPLASGSSKRARAAGNGAHTALCLVDGCNSDFSNCREYHRRHKVCEIHSKTPEVTIGGHKQRFCQQCSRFHSLEEFDEGKRSCRKRLDGHNKRRRKPQPEPMSHVGSFLSNYQGNQMMSTQVYPCTSVMNPSWAVSVSSEEEARQLYNQQQQQQLNLLEKQRSYLGSSSSSSSSYNKGKSSICQPLLMSMALPESGEHNMFCDRLTNTGPYGDCALSLLSSPQSHSQTSGISLAHLVHPNPAPLVQPLAQTHHHHHGLDPMDSVLVATGSGSGTAIQHYPPNFHLPSHDSPPTNVSQTLPFHWE